MLFDLRARGRRRTVQVVYLGLAALMALGLIGFGVGGGFGGGGLFEGLNSKNGGGSASFAAKTAAAEKRTTKHPNEADAWAALAEAHLHEASGAEFIDSTTGQYTSKGLEQLHEAARAWNHYLQLNPSSPSPKLALRMTSVFAEGALDQPASVVQALQIVIPTKPQSASLYSSLAEYAYLAHNTREGDLASKKALQLAPKTKRPLMELQFEKLKKKAAEESGAASTSTAAGSSATVTSTSTTSSTKTK